MDTGQQLGGLWSAAHSVKCEYQQNVNISGVQDVADPQFTAGNNHGADFGSKRSHKPMRTAEQRIEMMKAEMRASCMLRARQLKQQFSLQQRAAALADTPAPQGHADGLMAEVRRMVCAEVASRAAQLRTQMQGEITHAGPATCRPAVEQLRSPTPPHVLSQHATEPYPPSLQSGQPAHAQQPQQTLYPPQHVLPQQQRVQAPMQARMSAQDLQQQQQQRQQADPSLPAGPRIPRVSCSASRSKSPQGWDWDIDADIDWLADEAHEAAARSHRGYKQGGVGPGAGVMMFGQQQSHRLVPGGGGGWLDGAAGRATYSVTSAAEAEDALQMLEAELYAAVAAELACMEEQYMASMAEEHARLHAHCSSQDPAWGGSSIHSVDMLHESNGNGAVPASGLAGLHAWQDAQGAQQPRVLCPCCGQTYLAMVSGLVCCPHERWCLDLRAEGLGLQALAQALARTHEEHHGSGCRGHLRFGVSRLGLLPSSHPHTAHAPEMSAVPKFDASSLMDACMEHGEDAACAPCMDVDVACMGLMGGACRMLWAHCTTCASHAIVQ